MNLKNIENLNDLSLLLKVIPLTKRVKGTFSTSSKICGQRWR